LTKTDDPHSPGLNRNEINSCWGNVGRVQNGGTEQVEKKLAEPGDQKVQRRNHLECGLKQGVHCTNPKKKKKRPTRQKK